MRVRRSVLFLFCSLVLVFIAAYTPSAQAATGVVTGQVVNLRIGPGTNYQVVDKLAQGSTVTILSANNGWYQVKMTDGRQGWMSSQYLRTSDTVLSVNDKVTLKSSGGSGAALTNLRKEIIAKSAINDRHQQDAVPRDDSAANTPSRGNVDRPPNGEIPNSSGSPLVVIDPGHGGNDPGAIYFGANEKDLNLAMALKLGQSLEQAGYQVIYTRDTDSTMALGNRSQIANSANATIFISIHCNASTSKGLSGTSTYYTVSDNASLTSERLQLAAAVHSSLVSNLEIADKGVRTARFLVTRETTMPSILVETAFMSNSQDYAILSNDEKQWVIARSITQGVVNYFSGN